MSDEWCCVTAAVNAELLEQRQAELKDLRDQLQQSNAAREAAEAALKDLYELSSKFPIEDRDYHIITTAAAVLYVDEGVKGE
jgi:tricorn protease-like protein